MSAVGGLLTQVLSGFLSRGDFLEYGSGARTRSRQSGGSAWYLSLCHSMWSEFLTEYSSDLRMITED